MKVKNVYCANEGKIAPANHWSGGDCPYPPMPLGLIRAIMSREENDLHHRDGKLTATRLLTCPREVAILDSLPVTYNPMRGHSAYIGTLVHAALDKHVLPGEYGEVAIPPTVFFAGTEYEIRVSGLIDHVTPDFKKIHDYKFHGDRSYTWKMKAGGSSPELRVQLSVYKLGIERNVPGAEVEELGVWHGAMTAATSDEYNMSPTPWFFARVEPMTEEQILLVRPQDNEKKPRTQPYTVGDFILQYKQHFERLADGMSPEASIKMMPLVGRKMFQGKKCTNYCAAQRECDALEGIAWQGGEM